MYLGRGPNPGEERVAVKVLRSTVDANVLERLGREHGHVAQVLTGGRETHPAGLGIT